jgi:hypothetical protein
MELLSDDTQTFFGFQHFSLRPGPAIATQNSIQKEGTNHGFKAT